MTTQQPQQPTLHKGIVKQVLSGDSVIIRGLPKGGPPPEKQLCLSNIVAPKLARRPNAPPGGETKDEPYAFDAREFLRKKLVGKEVTFTVEYKVPGTSREYGCVFLGKDTSSENVTESLISEGLVKVRRAGLKANDEQQKLGDLEDAAKNAGRGMWSKDQEHVRDIVWIIENPKNFVDSLHHKPVKAVIEHVRDGSTVRALLFPNYQYITLMMSGIRCPTFKMSEDEKTQIPEPFADQAKFFSESRLLQRDVEVILESASNNNFVGTILHPNGSIAELLLTEGFARCVDWSMAFVSTSAEKLRSAERSAKEKRLRIWKDYNPSILQIDAKSKEFGAKVTEIVSADCVMVKTNEGVLKKIFLASVRPPRSADNAPAGEAQPRDQKGNKFRPLYDIPYMYEAREFLRQKLIGKKVNVVVDYIQPPSNGFPERTCCTVTMGQINVAEALVLKGLATIVRYRQDDDQRSSRYDDLLAAESKAIKSGKGMHSKQEIPIHRVADLSGDSSKAKQFLPFLQRAGRSEAIVEYVSSGSRLRLYVPKETCLITFLLAGISCPRASRTAGGGTGGESIQGEPFGDDALAFTKELCMQREVEIEVDAMDRAGNFIGWLWVDDNNHSVSLVDAGFASVHSSAERSVHYSLLQAAEESSKKRRENIWSKYEEPKEQEIKDDIIERSIDLKAVVVTDIRPDLHFFAQYIDQGPKLETLLDELRSEFASTPPLPGSYTPKKGDICAAKFAEDDQWYRAKVEKVAGNEAHVIYIDYGNREVTKFANLATLPGNYQSLPPAAREFTLACASLPKDVDFQQEAVNEFSALAQSQTLLLNTEYRLGGLEYVTLQFSDTKEDVGKTLISEGLLLVELRKEKRLQKLVTEYRNVQESAKKSRKNIWCYGDFTEDECKEFGYQR
ncbi:hypothetical protein CHUAL_013139 [Chamberlinius hualienensis]